MTKFNFPFLSPFLSTECVYSVLVRLLSRPGAHLSQRGGRPICSSLVQPWSSHNACGDCTSPFGPGSTQVQATAHDNCHGCSVHDTRTLSSHVSHDLMIDHSVTMKNFPPRRKAFCERHSSIFTC
jgi:hypothetical protein